MKIEKYRQITPFPDDNLLSAYNIKVLTHFVTKFPYLIQGKYVFFKKIIRSILNELSSTSSTEIKNYLVKTLERNELCVPPKLGYLKEGLIYPMILYFAVRVIEPEIVIETGVHSGRSTSFILQALHDNHKGKLYSLDLGKDVEYNSESGKQIHTLPAHIKTGWIIPDELKYRWKLILGDSKENLPKLLSELDFIDIFSHDGEHTDENMTFEYELAMKHLKNNGALMSDDVLFGQNTAPKEGNLNSVQHYNAWLDFSKKYNKSHIINYKVGFMYKKTLQDQY